MRVCAWCQDRLISKDADSGPISHGICAQCEDLFLRPGIPSREFLATLPGAVFLLDPRGKVVAGNEAGRAAAGRPSEEVEGFLGGEIFRCVFCRLPERCGRSVHCSGCTIRMCVVHTLRTGENLARVPATLEVEPDVGTETIRFLVSTQRLGKGVLLKVEEIRPEREATVRE